MPKDVRLPDGTIVRNVPDNITKSELMRRIEGRPAANIIDPTADASPASGGIRGFLEGVGSGIADVGLGIRQIPAEIGSMLPPSHLTAGSREMSPILRAEVAGKRELDAPLVDTGSGLAGKVTGNILATLPAAAIPGANSLMGASLIGAGLGLTQPAESLEERTLNTLIGGGGGAVGQKVGSALFSRPLTSSTARASTGSSGASVSASGAPTARVTGGGSGFGSVGQDASAGLTAGQKLAAMEGTDLGMRLTPGQVTGSRSLQQMEAKLSSQPMTSGPFNAIRDNNQRVLNSTWAKAIGTNGDDLSSPVLADVFERLSAQFEAMPQKIGKQPIDPKSALNLLAELQGDLRGVTSKPIMDNSFIKEFIKLAERGEATGDQLRSITSRLGKRINTEFTSPAGDRNLAVGLSRLKDSIDDVIQSGLSGEDQAAYKTVREQYRNYTLLTQRVNVIDPSSGNINGVSLAKLLQTKDRPGFLRGGNQSAHYNAARFAQAFKDIVGDSGTATRSMISSPIDAIASAPFNILSRAYTSPTSVSAAAGADSALQQVSRLLGPVGDPRITGLLGANLAVQSGK